MQVPLGRMLLRDRISGLLVGGAVGGVVCMLVAPFAGAAGMWIPLGFGALVADVQTYGANDPANPRTATLPAAFAG